MTNLKPIKMKGENPYSPRLDPLSQASGDVA